MRPSFAGDSEDVMLDYLRWQMKKKSYIKHSYGPRLGTMNRTSWSPIPFSSNFFSQLALFLSLTCSLPSCPISGCHPWLTWHHFCSLHQNWLCWMQKCSLAVNCTDDAWSKPKMSSSQLSCLLSQAPSWSLWCLSVAAASRCCQHYQYWDHILYLSAVLPLLSCKQTQLLTIWWALRIWFYGGIRR